jgi:DNA-directed RNA polymerase specialized sigma subunit
MMDLRMSVKRIDKLAPEEGALIGLSKVDDLARTRVLRAYLPLVVKTAVRGAHKDERAEEDLVGVCAEALCKALDRFTPRGDDSDLPRFTASAQRAVRGAIQNFRCREGYLIKVTGTKRGRELYSDPERAETESDRELLHYMTHGEVSLQAKFNDELTVEETMSNTELANPEEQCLQDEERAELAGIAEEISAYIKENYNNYEQMCWQKFVETGNDSPGISGRTREEGKAVIECMRAELQMEFG